MVQISLILHSFLKILISTPERYIRIKCYIEMEVECGSQHMTVCMNMGQNILYSPLIFPRVSLPRGIVCKETDYHTQLAHIPAFLLFNHLPPPNSFIFYAA